MGLFYIEKQEAFEILISVIAVSLALAVSSGGLEIFLNPKLLLILMFLFLVTVGSGFILHEMAHKLVAVYYGAYARFQMWVHGLVFMLALSIFGFVFAAPGAVYIYSDRISKRENGLISAAGPVTNIVLALFFLGIAVFAPLKVGGYNVWMLGARVNSFLALFNMIPIFPLDGSKVFGWSWIAWGAIVISSLGLFLGLGGF